MKTARRTKQRAIEPRISVGMMKLFAAYSRRYVRRNFTALRILKSGLPPGDPSRPLVIFLNHASWWDPLVCLLLSGEFFPTHNSFAPMDSTALERYRFFKHLGFFGIEPQTQRGARTFLGITDALLASSRNALWLTPQGRFMDVRERPVQLRAGVGALAAREPGTIFLPLAIEYTFWTEPRPEILVAFGDPVLPGDEPGYGAAEWTDIFADALESVQNELAVRSCRREVNEWIMLNRGKSGVSGIYDSWRRLQARIHGEEFERQHCPEVS